jgi:DivIVA domain-containing protein
MLVAAVACLLGLAVVLLVVYADGPLEPPAPREPDWELLPTPGDLARADFPLAFPGYDPASVETHLDLLRRAYTDLLAVAPPEVVQRARQRAAMRAGLDPEEFALPDDPPGTRRVREIDLEAPDYEDYGDAWTDEHEHELGDEPEVYGDELRLQAALASVDPPDRRRRRDRL